MKYFQKFQKLTSGEEKVWKLFYQVLFNSSELLKFFTLYAFKFSEALLKKKPVHINHKNRSIDLHCKLTMKTDYPDNISLFKVNNRNNRKKCQICSKLTVKIDVVLVSVMLILNIFAIFFNCFYCSLWVCICFLGGFYMMRALTLKALKFSWIKSKTQNRFLFYLIL